MIPLRSRTVPYITVAAAVCAVFGASLGAGFHFDDYALLSDAAVASPTGWLDVWRAGQTRPLTYFTFWINYALGGSHAAGYHAVNLVIHLGCVLLLYGVLVKLIPERAAFIATLVFAIHPIQTESVVYIFARAGLLMTLLCLASLREWLNGRQWIAVLWFTAALLAKEECVAFPLLLLLLHVSASRSRRELRPIGMMLVLSVAAGARVLFATLQNPASGAGAGAGVGPLQYLSAQGCVILRYFRLLLVPWGFTIDPEISMPAGWQAMLAWIVLLGLMTVAARRFTGVRAGFWFLGGMILLLPSSSVFPAADLAADRRLYLPLVAFAPMAGLLLRRVNGRVLAAGAVVLAALTFARVSVWGSEETLWSEAVRRAPNKVRPKIQLSRAVGPERGLELLLEAKKIAPDDYRVATELGGKYLALGRTAEALAEFGRALALAPEKPLAHNNRGVALLALGQREAARRDFEQALALDPCFFDARLNLLRMGIRTTVPASCRYTERQWRLLGEATR